VLALSLVEAAMQNGVIHKKVAGPGYVALVTVSGPQGKPRFRPAKELAPEASDAIFRGAGSPKVAIQPEFGMRARGKVIRATTRTGRGVTLQQR
jgi:hypothetical protein